MRAFLRNLSRIGAVALGAALFAGCTDPVNVAPPRAFNRAARVVFVCFDASAQPTAMSECVLPTGGYRSGFRFIALVPQQTRGEVAAVELSSDPPRVLDSDPRVPRFTFVETGEVPTAIAVSETNPVCTWVANRGSRDVWGIETLAFIDQSRTNGASARLALDAVEIEPGVRASGRPQAMLLHESVGSAELFVTLPEDGVIARIPVSNEGCTLGTPTFIPVPVSVPDPPPVVSQIDEPTLEPLASQSISTLAMCPTAPDLLEPAPGFVPVEPAASELAAPMPLEMVFERASSLEAPTGLLIGDGAGPVIHRFDFALGAFIDGLRTDGPIRDLTLTSPVPDDEGVRQYIYAIDARDGSVMVIDLETGYVLPVQPANSGRPLRLPFPAPARAIEAIDTRSAGGVCANAIPPPDPVPAPEVLRGVFVSVALSDGTVRVVDVYDRDAVCRAGADASECSFVGNEQYSFIRRHRPRIGRRIIEPVALAEAPSALSAGATLRFDESGQAGALIPDFKPLSCPEGQSPVFAAGDVALICALADPWSAAPEPYAVTWEGAIPNTFSAAGRLVALGDGRVALDAPLDLCANGVLGGDIVAITLPELPEPLPEGVSVARCSALAGGESGVVEVQPLLAPIEDVLSGPASGAIEPNRTRILLREDTSLAGRTSAGEPLVVRDILDCYGSALFSYEIRVADAFAVVGSNSGFLHRVISDEAGRCVVDPAGDPLREGRARLGVPFVNRRIAFELAYDVAPPEVPDIVIRFQLANVPPQLSWDLGADPNPGRPRALTLPSEIVWNEATNTLYAIDELRRGLALIAVEPFQATRYIE